MAVYLVEDLAQHLISLNEVQAVAPKLETMLPVLITLAETMVISGNSRKRVVLAALKQLGLSESELEIASTLIDGIITITKSPVFQKAAVVAKKRCLKFC